jgi:hypothetical protein
MLIVSPLLPTNLSLWSWDRLTFSYFVQLLKRSEEPLAFSQIDALGTNQPSYMLRYQFGEPKPHTRAAAQPFAPLIITPEALEMLA